MWKVFEGVEMDFMEKPIVGSSCPVGSPASRARSVLFPAPSRPKHSTENSGLMGGGGGKQQGHRQRTHYDHRRELGKIMH